MPDVAESYIHRIGRTARAGASGVAISFCDAGEAGMLRQIERHTGTALAVAGGTPPARAEGNQGNPASKGRAGKAPPRGGNQHREQGGPKSRRPKHGQRRRFQAAA
jgi:ATP-dependent RNA helicase RhlE